MFNMMAGGDLDGDVYQVIWAEDLTKHLTEKSMYPPATYTKPKLINRKPPRERISDYLCFYFNHDNLGKIANIHLALCDQFGPKGPMRPECIELSQYQSVAVDFAKHGECVAQADLEKFEKMLNGNPDFQEKSRKQVR